MKIIFICFVSLWLMGCGTVIYDPKVITIENQSGLVVGYGFEIDAERGVTADHIYQAHAPLFYNAKDLKIRQRDRAADVLFFQTEGTKNTKNKNLDFKMSPTYIGENLFWKDGQGVVSSLGSSVTIKNRTYDSLITLTGQVLPGDSGLPVLNADQNLVGMIVGGAAGKVYITQINPVKK